MPRKEIIDRIEKYVDPFRITKWQCFKLADFDPGDTRGLRRDLLQCSTVWLVEEQDMLEAVEQLDLAYPTVDAKKKKGLQKARAALSLER